MKNIKMSNKVYDILVLFAQVILPGLGTLYAALAAAWGLPYTEPILATVVALDTFLGSVLKYFNVQYKKNQE